MKLIITVLFLINIPNCLIAQAKHLKVGDKMPDIPLGTVINNHTGKKKFSDFRGKLLILDFWNTSCGSCIAKWPYMEKLQSQFGDSIQIFIVNTTEDQKAIESKMKFLQRNNPQFHLPTLPSIVNATVLQKLFPHKYVPYHVWIGPNGRIKVEGSFLNTYPEKIRDFLVGKSITYIVNSDGEIYDPKKPLSAQVNAPKSNTILYSSFFTRFNDEFGLGHTAQADELKDTVSHTWRTTFRNNDVVQLYRYATYYCLLDSAHKYISIKKPMSRYCLAISDTLSYTRYFLPEDKVTDESYKRSSYCYEIITPDNISDETRRKYILDDLNRYFTNLLNIKIIFEHRNVTCYTLTAGENFRKYQSLDNVVSSSEIQTINNQKMIRYTCYSFKEIFENVFGAFENDKRQMNLLNETNFSGKVDITLPYEVKSVDELNKALAPYDLHIQEEMRNINMMVITDQK